MSAVWPRRPALQRVGCRGAGRLSSSLFAEFHCLFFLSLVSVQKIILFCLGKLQIKEKQDKLLPVQLGALCWDPAPTPWPLQVEAPSWPWPQRLSLDLPEPVRGGEPTQGCLCAATGHSSNSCSPHAPTSLVTPVASEVGLEGTFLWEDSPGPCSTVLLRHPSTHSATFLFCSPPAQLWPARMSPCAGACRHHTVLTSVRHQCHAQHSSGCWDAKTRR